jgi:DNA polymerase III epsilon subunit-like protein
MVLDTETTDFNGDIIQLAWIIYNLDTNQIIKKSNIYVKDRISTIKSQSIHNISLEKLRDEGVEFYQLMKEFIGDFKLIDTIVGHNISFDIRIIINNLRKFNINIIDFNTQKQISNIFDNYQIECTRKISGGKSLENLYLDLFSTNFLGAHNAMVDVESTLDCYLQLIKQSNNQTIKQSNYQTIKQSNYQTIK